MSFRRKESWKELLMFVFVKKQDLLLKLFEFIIRIKHTAHCHSIYMVINILKQSEASFCQKAKNDERHLYIRL